MFHFWIAYFSNFHKAGSFLTTIMEENSSHMVSCLRSHPDWTSGALTDRSFIWRRWQHSVLICGSDLGFSVYPLPLHSVTHVLLCFIGQRGENVLLWFGWPNAAAGGQWKITNWTKKNAFLSIDAERPQTSRQKNTLVERKAWEPVPVSAYLTSLSRVGTDPVSVRPPGSPVAAVSTPPAWCSALRPGTGGPCSSPG